MKRIKILAGISVFCMLFLCACGNSPIQTEGEEPQKQREEQPQEQREEEPQEQREVQPQEQQEEQPQEQREEPQEQSENWMPEQENQSENGKQTAAEGIQGNIISIDGNEFVISKIETFKLSEEDGGGELAVSIADGETVPQENKITVKYSEHTKFTMRISTDGINATDSEGHKENLKKDDSVIIEGTWNEDILEADSIVIYQFIN